MNTRLYMDGKKWAVMSAPIKKRSSNPGVNNPQTGQNAHTNATDAITPTIVAVGIIRGQ